jgi:hypothetical protein
MFFISLSTALHESAPTSLASSIIMEIDHIKEGKICHFNTAAKK